MAAAACWLTGCATPLPEVVKVPVVVPCIGAFPDRPAMSLNDALKAMDDERLVLTIAAERLEQGAYAAQAEAALKACR